MGRVLDVDRKTNVSTSTPLVYANGAADGAGNFGAGLGKVDTLPGRLEISFRPSGGDIMVGMAGKTASATVGWLIKDGEVFDYSDDIRVLNFLALAASTTLYLVYETE
jgi:hypothetical protein